jgi:hypothetical protein
MFFGNEKFLYDLQALADKSILIYFLLIGICVGITDSLFYAFYITVHCVVVVVMINITDTK